MQYIKRETISATIKSNQLIQKNSFLIDIPLDTIDNNDVQSHE